MNFFEIQSFLKEQVEKVFKLKGVTPGTGVEEGIGQVENVFKLKGVTPIIALISPPARLST